MKKRKGAIRQGADVISFKAIGYPLVIISAILGLLPFIMVISSSFMTETAIYKFGYQIWPKGGFSLESYKTIFKSPDTIIRAYGVTTLVTIVGTTLSVLLNAMTGYVLSRKDFKWRNSISFYFFFTTLFSGGLMPWYMLVSKYLHLSNTLFALILPSLVSVWNILLVKGFALGIPFEITESGKLDGAGDFTVFSRLILPLSKPVLATIGLFTALGFWNDWYNCMLFIKSSNLYNLQYQLYRLINNAASLKAIAAESSDVIEVPPIESMKMALTIVVTGPILFLYPFIQKYFVKGLTLGSVKG